MAIEYNKDDYEFKFVEFYNPFLLNPAITDTVEMVFFSKKQILGIQGESKASGDYSGFKEGIDPTTLDVSITPEDEDKIWTEALITNLKVIQCGSKDEIRISTGEGGFTPHLEDVLKRDHLSPVMKRALIGIKEADKVVREYFPGYCLTEKEI